LPGDSFKFQDPWWARVSGIVTVSTTNFDRMKGAFTISTTNYHSLDYGEVVVLTDEQKASAKAAAQKSVDEQARSLQDKALKSNQDAADKGDAYGQLRMGQRYRDGDGVPKDLAKAKEYFAKAAAQGDKQAANSLEQLNAANP
jgi:TPR repeat protein